MGTKTLSGFTKKKADPESDAPIQTDQDLVETASRDPAAFSKLYSRYVDPVYRYLYQWTGNSAEAEDLTSQVFIEVIEKLVHYKEHGKFVAWLFTIARNKAIAAHRRQRRNLSLEDAEQMTASTEDLLEQAMYDEQLKHMSELFSGLKEDQRELLRLRFTSGLSYAEISAVVGRSESAIKMMVLRLLRQLHAKWEIK